MSPRQIDFPLSIGEIDRRREAYTRLVSFTAIGSLASSFDQLMSHPATVTGLLLGLFALLFLSRTLFMSSFTRYARTVWSLTDTQLTRSDEVSHDEHELNDIKRIRVKRMVSGSIRAIGIDFRPGRSVYVNALRTPQEFLDKLLRTSQHVVTPTESREPIDFDHPWFYRLLGLWIGVALTSGARIAASVSPSGTKWVHLGVAAFMLGFGAYWLRAMPISRSYGEHRRIVDVVVGLSALGTGIGLGIVALVA